MLTRPMPGDLFVAISDDAPFKRCRVDAIDDDRYLIRDADEIGFSAVTPLSDDEHRIYYGEGTQIDAEGNPVQPGELKYRAEVEREAAYVAPQSRPTPNQIIAAGERDASG
jgi:hypothetical protein